MLYQNLNNTGPVSSALTYDKSEEAGDRYLHIFENGSRVSDPVSWVYSDAMSGQGIPICLQISSGLSGQSYLRWDMVSDLSRQVSRITFRTPSQLSSSSSYTLIQGLVPATAYQVILTSTASNLYVQGRVGIVSVEASRIGPLSFDTVYSVEAAFVPGTSLTLRVLDANELVVDTYTINDDFENLGLTQIRFGGSPPSGFGGPAYFGEIQVGPLASGWLGPIGSTTPLATPVLTLVNDSPASSVSANDREITVSWPAVPNASGYRALVAPYGSTDYTTVAESVTSPYTFLNRPAGGQRVAIQAKP